MKKSSVNKKEFRWKLLGLVPVVLAVVIVIFLVRTKSGPVRKEIRETTHKMRVIKVPVVDLIPRTSGYGVAEPGQIWRAVAEVKGRVVEVHPELKSGALVTEGAQLLKIDPIEYELRIAEIQANITEIKTQISEYSIQEKNTAASLKIENRSLQLAEKSLDRKKSVLKDNTIAPYEFEQEERNVLIQRQRVQDLENFLNLLPSKLQVLEAKLAATDSALQQARLDLVKTVIRAPFDCRIATVSIEPNQYLAAGQLLFEAHGIAVTEVEAQVQGEQLRHLIGPGAPPGSQDSLFIEAMQQLTAIKAIVRIRSGNWNIEWEARVDRLREAVDPETRAFNVIVAVDKPYEKVIPGQRPPLTRGLFTEVELLGPAHPASIVIPRSGLHNDTVYILDSENRLRPVSVVVDYFQGDLAVISSGLTGGETLIISDPTPAISDMLVTPEWDKEMQEWLVYEAKAERVLE
jgi:multidrug efflux pump subunit AcrA (membrane-fusion protein)